MLYECGSVVLKVTNNSLKLKGLLEYLQWITALRTRALVTANVSKSTLAQRTTRRRTTTASATTAGRALTASCSDVATASPASTAVSARAFRFRLIVMIVGRNSALNENSERFNKIVRELLVVRHSLPRFAEPLSAIITCFLHRTHGCDCLEGFGGASCEFVYTDACNAFVQEAGWLTQDWPVHGYCDDSSGTRMLSPVFFPS